LGVKTGLLRFVALLTASAVSAVIISSLGIIGFLGIVAPHIARRFVGNDHRVLIPASCLMGAVLLEVSDILSRLLLNGTSLPVGAVTALFGAPFFLYIIFRRKEVKDNALH
jgi:iron complex transport system permease protein